MDEMTFYIEEVLDGDPPPEPPPDDGEEGGFDPDEFVDMGDLTGQLRQEDLANSDNESDEEVEGGGGGGPPDEGMAILGANSKVSKGQKKKMSKKKKKQASGGSSAGAETDPMVGARVVLEGLVARADLNGCRGTVVGGLKQQTGAASAKGGTATKDMPPGRYPVAVDNGKGTFDLKIANLVVIPPWVASCPRIVSGAVSADGAAAATTTPPSSAPCGRGGAAAAFLDPSWFNESTLPASNNTPTLAGVESSISSSDKQGLLGRMCVIGGATRLGKHFNDVHLLRMCRPPLSHTPPPSTKAVGSSVLPNISEESPLTPPPPPPPGAHVVSPEMGGGGGGGEWAWVAPEVVKEKLEKESSGDSADAPLINGDGLLDTQGNGDGGYGGPCPRSGHSAVAFRRTDNGSGGAVVVVYGGADLSKGQSFGDVHQLLVRTVTTRTTTTATTTTAAMNTCATTAAPSSAQPQAKEVVEWRAVTPKAHPILGGSLRQQPQQQPQPRNAHTATSVTLTGLGAVSSSSPSPPAAAVGAADDPNDEQVMVVFGGSTPPNSSGAGSAGDSGGGGGNGGGGGDGGPVNEVLLLCNPASSNPTWVEVACEGPKPLAREMHSACAVPGAAGSASGSGDGGRKRGGSAVVVIAGGRLASEDVARDCWVLSLSIVESAAAAAASISSSGGGSGEERCPLVVAAAVKGVWRRVDDLPSPRCGHISAFLPSRAPSPPALPSLLGGGSGTAAVGTVVVFGGFNGSAFSSSGILLLEVTCGAAAEDAAAAAGGGGRGGCGDGDGRGSGAVQSFSTWTAEGLVVNNEERERESSSVFGGFERLSLAAVAAPRSCLISSSSSLGNSGSSGGSGGGCEEVVVVFGGVGAVADLADVFTIAPPGFE